MKVIIFTTAYDEATEEISKWATTGANIFLMHGFEVTYIANYTKRDVAEYLAKNNYDLVVFGCHGWYNALYGSMGEEAVVACWNDILLAGKEVFTLACKSAAVLGNSAMIKGAKGYVGWKEDFIFCLGKYAEPFRLAITKFFDAYAKTKDFLNATLALKNELKKQFEIWKHKDSTVASCLLHDLNNLVVFAYARRKELVWVGLGLAGLGAYLVLKKKK